jgi:beta-glucosidase/6-phospho-beta-glucosidase/beta-galactosidase
MPLSQFPSKDELETLTLEELTLEFKMHQQFASRVKYWVTHPECKHWRRANDRSNGIDPDINNPKRRVMYNYNLAESPIKEVKEKKKKSSSTK